MQPSDPPAAGLLPSRLQLPPGDWPNLLEGLCGRFPRISRAQWLDRFARGRVQDAQGRALAPGQPWQVGLEVRYYREVENEQDIPFAERIVHCDEHLLVADKPHFLPVVPAGRYLQQTLLVRLKREFDLPELSPIHRIDRDTAGLVVFSVQRATRGIYQALFRDRAIHKTYEAVAPWREDVAFPRTHESRMEESGHFFRMHEVDGTPNTRTHMQVLEQHGRWARYRLEPESGKRHQLRVHMAALGLPLWGDGFYPEVHDMPEGDYSRPLQLLARSLAFTDPLDGQSRRFDSRRQLLPLTDL